MADLPPDYLDELRRTLEAIERATELTSTLVPDKIAELTTALTETYKYSSGPSVPDPSGPVGGGPSGAASNQIPVPMGGATPAQVEANRTAALMQEAQARATLAQYGRSVSGATMSQQDITAALGPGGPSAGASVGGDWQGRVTPGSGVFHIPQFGNLTAQDLLGYGSTLAANMAGRSRGAAFIAARDPETGITDEALLTSLLDSSKGIKGWGGLSNAMSSMATGAAATKAFKDTLGRVMAPVHGMSNLAYQTGATTAPGSEHAFGFRWPWDSAFAKGLSRFGDQLSFSISNDVSPAQAGTIFSNLYGLGWMGGPNTNAMRSAASKMMAVNPVIASQPQYYSMMDESTRMGGASLQQFNDAMMQIPDSVNAAHLSIAQMMTDMDQLGQLNKSMGGTYYQGAANALAWTQTTGLPASLMGTLMQNPMVSAQTFMRTGLMPWEQGLASSGQHTQGILAAVQLLNHSMLTPQGKSMEIGNTGFFNNVSGEAQKEALMSHFLGISAQAVHSLLKNSRGISSGATLRDAANAYRNQLVHEVQIQHPRDAMHTLFGQGRGTFGQLHEMMRTAEDSQGHKIFEDWNQYNKLVHEHDPHTGHWELTGPRSNVRHWVGGRDYTKAEAHRIAQMDARANVMHAGAGIYHHAIDATQHRIEQDALNGRSDTQAVARLAALQHHTGGLSGAQITAIGKARSDAIKKYQAQNTAKFGGASSSNPAGQKVTIELGPAAKKVFHLQSPQGQQKNAQGAGAVSLNSPNSWATGPSYSPTPDLNTAGSDSYSTTDGNYGS